MIAPHACHPDVEYRARGPSSHELDCADVADATVTVCHSRTRDLTAEMGRADIVVSAFGKAEMIRARGSGRRGGHRCRYQPHARRQAGG